MVQKGCIQELDQNFTNVYASTMQADTISGATTAVGTGEVGEGELGTGAVTSVKQAFVGLGSPAAYALSVQVGSVANASVGSIWVTFAQNFKALPNVFTTPLVSAAHGALRESATSIGYGSFLLSGLASTAYSWMAVGSL